MNIGITQSRLPALGIVFILIILSGLWVSHSGRPINTLILTIHKLIGLGWLVLFVLTLHQVNQTVGFAPTEWAVGLITIAFFAVTIIVGGFLSTDTVMPRFVLLIHQILPFVSALCATASVYVLLAHEQA